MNDVLADTGSDFSVFPASVGDSLFEEVRSIPPSEIYGITAAPVEVRLHTVRFRIGVREFRALAGFADSNQTPPILGRYQALDRFTAVYTKGRSLALEW